MNAKRKQSGQAVVELTVSLVGILAVFCGFLLISKLSIQNVDNIIKARGNADSNAVDPEIVNLGANSGYFIRSWSEGADNYMYTADDTRNLVDVLDPSSFSEELQNGSFNLKEDLAKIDKYKNYNNFAPKTQDVNNVNFIFLGAAGLTSGSSSSSVSLDDLERFLYVDTSRITLKDEIYMPFTDNSYIVNN